MSQMTWTTAQQAAIDARRQNLLLSAAAGSGKTAVLTERIKKLITDMDDPADITELLVLTFTRASAGEMKPAFLQALQRPFRKRSRSEIRLSPVICPASSC